MIVGVNRYRPDGDPPLDILDIDNARVRAGQIARIEQVRANRDAAAAGAALDALREGAKGDANLLQLSVEAARARCTLGEISSALEDAFGRYDTVPTPVQGIYGAAWKDDPAWARAAGGVGTIERRLGRKPRMLVAKMGQDGHDRGANLVSSAFARPGVRGRAGAAVPDARGKREAGGGQGRRPGRRLQPRRRPQDPGSRADRPPAHLGRADIKVVVGGVIPPQDYDMLRAAGVQAIFGPGTNLVEAAGEVLKLLGHNLPPLEEAAE